MNEPLDLDEDEADRQRAAVRDERNRCRLLVKTRSDMIRRDAARLRKAGEFTTRAIWPPFKKLTFVAPKWEQRAREMEAVAHAFDSVQRGIELGWDLRKVENLNEKIDL